MVTAFLNHLHIGSLVDVEINNVPLIITLHLCDFWYSHVVNLLHLCLSFLIPQSIVCTGMKKWFPDPQHIYCIQSCEVSQ